MRSLRLLLRIISLEKCLRPIFATDYSVSVTVVDIFFLYIMFSGNIFVSHESPFKNFDAQLAILLDFWLHTDKCICQNRIYNTASQPRLLFFLRTR